MLVCVVVLCVCLFLYMCVCVCVPVHDAAPLSFHISPGLHNPHPPTPRTITTHDPVLINTTTYWPADVDYQGGTVDESYALARALHGGQVVLTQSAWIRLQGLLPPSSVVCVGGVLYGGWWIGWGTPCVFCVLGGLSMCFVLLPCFPAVVVVLSLLLLLLFPYHVVVVSLLLLLFFAHQHTPSHFCTPPHPLPPTHPPTQSLSLGVYAIPGYYTPTVHDEAAALTQPDTLRSGLLIQLMPQVLAMRVFPPLAEGQLTSRQLTKGFFDSPDPLGNVAICFIKV